MVINTEQECKELKEAIKRLESNLNFDVKTETLFSFANAFADCETIDYRIKQIKEKIAKFVSPIIK